LLIPIGDFSSSNDIIDRAGARFAPGRRLKLMNNQSRATQESAALADG
jgi:hypothetical protein